MPYIRLPGVIGRVYDPPKAGAKKHNCKDCFFCQFCSDQWCLACRKQKKNKNSQIQLLQKTQESLTIPQI